MAAAIFLAALALNLANVVGRYIFLTPIYWAEEMITFLIIYSVFLAAAEVAFHGEQLRIEAIDVLLPLRLRTLHQYVISGLSAGAVAFVAVQSFGLMKMLTVNAQRSTVAEIPMNIPFAAIPLGFALLALSIVARIVGQLNQSKELTHKLGS
jgi:TRAP-type C4-dicarboxylate transport system permease small subunit